jgi:hypothetical protein
MVPNQSPEHLAWLARAELDPRWPDIALGHIQRELVREGQNRARLYPKWVSKGKMIMAEAAYQREVIAALGDDVGRMLRNARYEHPAHNFSWKERLNVLNRELDFRAQLYPSRIAKGMLIKADATHQIACFEALRHQFETGFDWRASNGSACHWGKVGLTPEERAAQDEYRAWDAAINEQRQRRDAVPSREEMML